MHLAGPPDAARTTSSLLQGLILVLLVQLVITQSVYMFPRLLAVDFYHYWGVATAFGLKGEALGTPYRNPREYAAVLAEYGSRPGDERLTSVSRILTQPGFTATPFFYWLFAALPRDYTLALALFHGLQVILFVAAIITVGLVYDYPRFPLAGSALILALGSGAFSSDLRVGNVGSFQFAALAALLALVHRLRHSTRPVTLASLILTGLTLLALAKPNVALVAVVMAVHLWRARGTRILATAAAPAALAGALAVILPCLYFRSWTAWQAWYQVVFGANPYGLAKAPGPGNYSTTKLLAGWLHLPMGTVVPVVAVVITLSLLAAAIAASRRPAGGGVGGMLRAVDRLFGDPDRAMAIAVVLTMALPPLFWYHYYLVALIPGFWLLSLGAPPGLPLLGLASLLLSTGLLNVLFIPLGWTQAVGAAAALSWVPLWVGVILAVYAASPRPAEGEPVPPGSVQDQERRAEPGRPRRGARGPRTAARV